MRAVLMALLLGLSLSIAGAPARSQATGIEDVISSQIDAFRADDFDTAFGLAHDNIQQIFRTPDIFRQMVTQGYPMVWRPADVTFLGQRGEGARVFQDVEIVDAQGRVFVLEYTMIETPAGWRIAGVRILEEAAVSA